MPFIIYRGTSVPSDVTVTFGDVRQTMDGFGAADTDDKPFALQSSLRTLLWDPSAGIGLSIFRAQIGEDGNPRVDPTDYAATPWDKWGEMKAARTINSTDLRFMATPWTPPPAMKDSGTESGGHLLAAQRSNWAALMASFVTNGAAQTPAIPFFAIGAQNEPDFTAPSSCLYTAAEMTAFLPVLRTALDGVTGTPAILMPETSQWPLMAAYVSDWETNGSPQSAVAYYATHQYTGVVNAPTSTTTKHYWQTEMAGLSGQVGGTWDPSITNGLVVAGWIYDAIVNGNVSAWIWWWFMDDFGTGDPPVGDDNEMLIVNGTAGVPSVTPTVTKRLYVLGNWSKFVRPGWVRCGISGTFVGLSLTAFKNPATGDFAIVAINATGSTRNPLIGLSGLNTTTVTPWLTDATHNLVAQTPISVLSTQFHAPCPANSVTTFVGTGT